jgi:glycosyltransferase involved in cell wall biosynthesis
LAVNHAFAHGVPAVVRPVDLNAPEVEYVAHGRNGLVVDGGLDAFADALASLVDSPQRRSDLAAGAAATAEGLGLDGMVRAFDDGVRAALAHRAPPRVARAARRAVAGNV